MAPIRALSKSDTDRMEETAHVLYCPVTCMLESFGKKT
jgi:hypothetical protein